VTGTVVVDAAAETPDVPDELVHPAARRTARVMIVREKRVIFLIVHRLYRDPIILPFCPLEGVPSLPPPFF
jgi:hypothetical protein